MQYFNHYIAFFNMVNDMLKLENNDGNITAESKSVFSYRMHMHSYYEMTLYRKFDGNISINNNRYTIDSNTCVLVCPSDFHEITVTKPSNARYIKIGFSFDSLAGQTPDSSVIMTDIGENDLIVKIFEETLENISDKEYTQLLISCAVRNLTKYGHKMSCEKSSKGVEVATSAYKMLHEMFDTHITLDIVAKRLFVSPQYLSCIFKKTFGMNFSEYLILLRMQRAKHLITTTDKSITQICYDVGYNNFSHFSRSFKKEYGLSPYAYRKKYYHT